MTETEKDLIQSVAALSSMLADSLKIQAMLVKIIGPTLPGATPEGTAQLNDQVERQLANAEKLRAHGEQALAKLS